MNSWTLIITSLILLMPTMLPSLCRDLLQADSVLQSMPLLLHWA